MKIDIIIPIYNAYEYVVECVSSIYSHTKMDDFSLYLINDCSPDKRILPFLESIENKFGNVVVLDNEVNLGFVGTVNKGMRASKNDVILLNSDTEVTENWLEQMKFAAYHDDYVATVTCLTNSGVICSVPNFCLDNELPFNYSYANDFARLIHNHSMYIYPEAPTGVGFCMYIKRELLDKVGFFDEANFGKGYGEENDFCCRCIELGYKNIIDDATFVYHKGSMSFNEDKAELCKKNSDILGNIYPYYFSNVSAFIEDNPLKKVHETVKFLIKIRDKKNILYLLHNDFIEGRNHPIGGTEFHVRDLCNGMKTEYNQFVMTTHKRKVMLDIISGDFIESIEFPLVSSIKQSDIHRKDYRKVVESILNYFEISLVHIHHMKGHTMDVIHSAKQLDIPILYTLHDFYSLCPCINLLYNHSIYCRFLRKESTCNECIHKTVGFHGIAETWRESFAQMLLECDKILVPSDAVKTIVTEFFKQFETPLEVERFKTIAHGRFESEDINDRSNLLNEKFTICIFGGISPHKGSSVIRKLLDECDNNIEWHILGNIYDDVALYERNNVTVYGTYEQADIIGLLYKINPDIVLATPICPETFSYVISEAFMADIPVLGTNLGALSTRIIEGENGWLLPFPLDVSYITGKIHDLSCNRNKIQEVKRKMAGSKNRTVSAMIDDYNALYIEHFHETITYNHNKESNEYMGSIISQEERVVFIPQQEETVSKVEFDSLLDHIQTIHESTSWKYLQKVSHFIDKIKSIFRKRG